MTALLTTKFKHNIALGFVNSSYTESYYTCMGKPTPFESDKLPPSPEDSIEEGQLQVFRYMVFGKEVAPNDMNIVIHRYDWTSGEIYDMYDHQDGDLYENKKFFVVVNEGLFYSVFKCLNNNKNSPSISKPSFYETSAEEDFYITSDGYQWKYMYKIDKTDFRKFSTNDFIPVYIDKDVHKFATNGAIETVTVTSSGSRYNAYTSGTIQVASVGGNNQLFTIESTSSSNTDFYKNSAIKIVSGPGAGQQRIVSSYIVSGGVKRVLVDKPFNILDTPTEESNYVISPNVVVDGDGKNFVGRAIIDPESNTVSSIEITNRGENYSYANAYVISNTGIIDITSKDAIVADTAELRVIISPSGGHGYNPETELGGTRVCVSQTMNTEESAGKLVSENDVRTISVFKDMIIRTQTLLLKNISTYFSVDDIVIQRRKSVNGEIEIRGVVSDITGNQITIINANRYYYPTTEDYETVKLTNEFVYSKIYTEGGFCEADVDILGPDNPTIYFDQTVKLGITLNSSTKFQEDEIVRQGSYAYGYVYSSTDTEVRIVSRHGLFNVQDITDKSSDLLIGEQSKASAKITSIHLEDMLPYSGEVLYIDNIRPIKRHKEQSERVRVILEF